MFFLCAHAYFKCHKFSFDHLVKGNFTTGSELETRYLNHNNTILTISHRKRPFFFHLLAPNVSNNNMENWRERKENVWYHRKDGLRQRNVDEKAYREKEIEILFQGPYQYLAPYFYSFESIVAPWCMSSREILCLW